MQKAATIQEFHALLTGQEGKDSQLVSLLRGLSDAIKPEDIVKLGVEAIVWADWRRIEY